MQILSRSAIDYVMFVDQHGAICPLINLRHVVEDFLCMYISFLVLLPLKEFFVNNFLLAR